MIQLRRTWNLLFHGKRKDDLTDRFMTDQLMRSSWVQARLCAVCRYPKLSDDEMYEMFRTGPVGATKVTKCAKL